MIDIGKEYIDDLTGLYNRRFLNLKVGEFLGKSGGEDALLSIVLIDLDHFKNVNDTYGHSRGDTVLSGFASFLESLLRKDDTVFRYGGDEFVCILPYTDYEQAKRISQRFIESCRSMEFSQIRITSSIGIASFPDDGNDWSIVFDTADQRLYSAKRHGRDRIGVPFSDSRNLIIPSPDIIGRDTEMAELVAFTKCVFGGTGGAVCVSGEIGVGKTRLVREISQFKAFRQVSLLISNLSATTRSIPYYPFREIVRAMMVDGYGKNIEKLSGTYRIELAKIVPELSNEPMHETDEVLMVDRFRLFEGVRKFLELYFAEKPLFVFIDNVHWADEGSLELLHYLVRAFRESPVIFFIVYRVEEIRAGAFRDVLSALIREDLVKIVSLEPLPAHDVSRIISMIIDNTPSLSLSDCVYRKAGGNPFFIEELLKSLESDKALYWKNSEWIFDSNIDITIPHSIEGVIERKLAILDSEAYVLLEHAAVIGRMFDFRFLQNVSGMNEGHLFDLIDEILDIRLLAESGGETFCFTEDIIREIIYNRMNEARRKRYHIEIGEKLLAIYVDRTEAVVEELAFHFLNGGDQEKAIDFSITAGNRARDAYANLDAIRFYTWAIDILENTTMDKAGNRLVECLRSRASVFNLTGDNEKSIEDLNRAIATAGETGNTEEEADCLIAACMVFEDTAQYEEAIDLSEKALAICRQQNNVNGEVSCLKIMGSVHRLLGRYDEALEYFHQALGLSEELTDREVEIKILTGMGTTHAYLGEYNKALEHYRASLELGRNTENRKAQAANLNNIGNICYLKGDYKEALECYDQSMGISEEIGNRKAHATNLNNMGSICCKTGNYHKAHGYFRGASHIFSDIGDRKAEAATLNNVGIIRMHLGDNMEAITAFRNALSLREAIGDRNGTAESHSNIGIVRYRLGEYAEAHEHLDISLRTRTEISDREGQVKSLCSKGQVFLEEDETTGADSCFGKAEAIAREIGSRPLLVTALMGLAHVLLEKNDLVPARKCLEELSSLSNELDSREIAAETSLISGIVLYREGKTHEAETSLKQSVEGFEELGDDFLLARAVYFRGLIQMESDGKSAKDSFTRSGELFSRIGASGWIKRLESVASFSNDRMI